MKQKAKWWDFCWESWVSQEQMAAAGTWNQCPGARLRRLPARSGGSPQHPAADPPYPLGPVCFCLTPVNNNCLSRFMPIHLLLRYNLGLCLQEQCFSVLQFGECLVLGFLDVWGFLKHFSCFIRAFWSRCRMFPYTFKIAIKSATWVFSVVLQSALISVLPWLHWVITFNLASLKLVCLNEPP